MSRVQLLPRLNELGVMKIMEYTKRGEQSSDAAIKVLDEHSSFLWYAPSGGSPSPGVAAEIAAAIREIAIKYGFPTSTDQKQRAGFDTEAAIYLGGSEVLSTGEGLRDDVWAFLTSAHLLDVLSWRFPDRNPERIRGGVRNAFQRLWVRGKTLDLGQDVPNRWSLVEALSEDAMVQIFERASLAADHALAQAIAAAWLETSRRIGKARMEDVMRSATKMIRLRNEIVDLGFLDQAILKQEIEAIFFRAAGVGEEKQSSFRKLLNALGV